MSAKPVTEALREIELTLAISNVRTIDSAMTESLARERISALISTSFGVGGLLLAVLGLYGSLAYLVAERTKDIGIRIALGARLVRITGSVVGGPCACRDRRSHRRRRLAAAPARARLASLRVTPYDVPTYATVLVLLGTTPPPHRPARPRAARIEPLTALRQE